MSKRLILILALAFVVGIAFAAYAEVQNVKVSGDLTVQGVSRSKLMLHDSDLNALTGTPYAPFESPVTAILSAARVRIDADLTDNVATTVRLLNERAWDEETASSSDIDLDLAYVTLKEFLYSPLSLTIGRQELAFGNQLIIGDVDTNGIAAGHTGTIILPKSLDDLSLRKAFDAIRATLNYDPLVIDGVYAKIDENSVDVSDDVDLYGLNANYALDKTTTLEAYYWEKRRSKAGAGTSIATSGPTQYNNRSTHDIVRTLGARAQYTGVKNLLLGLEGALQFGRKVNNTTLYPNETLNDGAEKTRKAYAVQTTARYNLSDLVEKYSPVVNLGYTLLSGNNKDIATSNKYTGWDAMFENQAGGTLFNKILGFSNVHLINVGASAKPMEDLKLSLDYYYLRLVKALSGTTVSGTSVCLTGVVGDPTYIMKYGEKGLGNEVDATLTYDYTEDVQLSLSAGWFNPGSAFDSARNGDVASQVIGSMKVTF